MPPFFFEEESRSCAMQLKKVNNRVTRMKVHRPKKAGLIKVCDENLSNLSLYEGIGHCLDKIVLYHSFCNLQHIIKGCGSRNAMPYYYRFINP